MTRETGNVEDNRANDNGAVEVGEGELEAAFCSSDDCREVIEDLETNKTLNEDNLLDGDTKLGKENTSEGDELMDRDSTSKEDDALMTKELRMKVRVIKTSHSQKSAKKLFVVKQFWEKSG